MGAPAIEYEFGDKPANGHTMEIAPGVYWLRMPLPFSLEHINLWLFSDGDGWVVVDTGLGDDASKDIWRHTFDDAMDGRKVRHVIVTHMHPDHVGCAGWLTRQFDVDLWMSRGEYAMCRILVADTGKPAPDIALDFYKAAGYTPEALERYRKAFGFFGKYITPLPESYRRLYDGLRGPVGDHDWEVVVGRGHSPEHACFYSKEFNLLVSGDQILPAISSNVSVFPTEPEANPLNDWIRSLNDIKTRVPADVLVLPAHGKPFRGAHERIDQLVNEHLDRLDALLAYCKEPRRVVDTFPALYRARINKENLMFATGEAIAHLHYLINENQIAVEQDADGVNWYQRVRG